MFIIGQEYPRKSLLSYVGSKQSQSGIIWGPDRIDCVIVTPGGRHSNEAGYHDERRPEGKSALKRVKIDPDLVLPSEARIEGFRQRITQWFRAHGRHFPWRNKSATVYQKIIAEILLQRTQAATAARFLPRFLAKYPSWKKLDEESEELLMQYLKPIGLWRQRAAGLKKLAREMEKRGGRFPNQREAIEGLPGIGQYIANAILLFRHGDRQPLLDVNMARLLERYFGPRKLVDIRYDPYLQQLSRKILQKGDPIELNWAILDHAALICKKQPRCIQCPLSIECSYFNSTRAINTVENPGA